MRKYGMISDSPRAADYIRQSLNLVLGSIMWLCSSLNLIFEGARSPADMSDSNDSLLVPFGAAFSIWLPIFVLCFIYAVLQALPRNRTEPVYRALGWWTAAGFGGVCLWGITNAFAPMTPFDWALWGTAIIFVPTMLFLVKAMLIATSEKNKMTKFERYTVHMGLSLIAGWCSIAVFLNWTPQIVRATGNIGVTPDWACAALVFVVCFWVRFITIKCNGNKAYAFPVLWGLSFLLVELLIISKPENADVLRSVIAPAGIILLIPPLLIMKYSKPVSTKIFARNQPA